MKTRKRTHEKVVRTSISMSPDLMRAASAEQSKLGFTAFSDFVQHLIRSTVFGQQPK